MTLEYKQSLSELNTILSLMGMEYSNKLPKKLIKFIKENMDNSYISDINVNTPINEQPIKNDTKILLSLLYRNYWCSEEKKKLLLEEDASFKSKHEKELYEKYNPDKVFKNKTQKIICEERIAENISMVEYKESIFTKIKNWIKKIFNQ